MDVGKDNIILKEREKATIIIHQKYNSSTNSGQAPWYSKTKNPWKPNVFKDSKMVAETGLEPATSGLWEWFRAFHSLSQNGVKPWYIRLSCQSSFYIFACFGVCFCVNKHQINTKT